MNKEYKIKGMACAHCKATVEKNLAKLPGVTSVAVDLTQGVAYVEGEHDEKAAIEMISSLGFEPVI
ncbi:MAG: heavy-metal-associated domain-containing protein [Bacteroides sp.]|nr:heavy-metal-associated domain-containing protein [Bacteroides sp.]